MAEESKARYAIVRVDKITKRDTDYYVCPSYFENINDKFVCDTTHKDHIACKDCRYGDTKKQLIEKVAQAGIKYYEKVGWNRANFQDAARFIVEFLGVK